MQVCLKESRLQTILIHKQQIVRKIGKEFVKVQGLSMVALGNKMAPPGGYFPLQAFFEIV